MFQVLANVPHPYLGSGALLLLRLGLNVEPAQADKLATELNLAEASEPTGFPLIGAWTRSPDLRTVLAHVTFLPTSIFDAGLLGSVAFYSSLRNEWAHQRLLPKSR
jgi:hypothetical protein